MVQHIKTIVLIVATISLSSIHPVYGQKKQVDFHKNAVYGSVGTTVFYASATGYYERMVSQRGKISSLVKVGAGTYETLGGSGIYILGQYGILTGVKKHHLELGAGPAYFIKEDLREGLFYTATIGWRIQKPGGKFIFRMGVSVPESIYIGIGISF